LSSCSSPDIRQQNHGNNEEAICTTARQPHIPLVSKKSTGWQDTQALHRARQRMVHHRTAVVSQIRGLLLDRGFAIGLSITRARRVVPELLADLGNELTALARGAFTSSMAWIVGSTCLMRRSRRCSGAASPASAEGAICWRLEARLHHDRGVAKAFRRGRVYNVSLWTHWRAIICPVLVLRGEGSDLLPASTATEITRRCPHAELLEILGCGHAPALLDEDQVGLVADWPERVR